MRNVKIIIAAILGFGLIGCVTDSTERKDTKAVNKQQEHYQVAQPLPSFDFSLERDVAIQLYQARNEKVATWTVWRSDMGQVEGDGPSIGYPIPYDTSLTNPLKIMYAHSSTGIVEQAEPNGLFSSKNSIATWVRCVTIVNDSQVEAPVYVESRVTAYPFPVNVDYENNRVQPVKGAAPSISIKSKE